jgi:magnesium-transporting ATPase (P-type)
VKAKTDHTKTPGSKLFAKDDLKSLPLAEVEKKLGSSPDGLTQAEAQIRLTQYGPNEIEEKKTNELLKFLSYFWGPIPWMIEVAVILSAAARHWPDFGIILLLLLANAVVGFWEEHQASADSMGCGARHATAGDPDCGVLRVHDSARLGLGGVCVGLAWFLINDRVKLLAYRILDPAKARTAPPDLNPAAFRQRAGTRLAKGAG